MIDKKSPDIENPCKPGNERNEMNNFNNRIQHSQSNVKKKEVCVNFLFLRNQFEKATSTGV